MVDQAQTNYTWFLEARQGMLASHKGEHALLYQRDVAAFFPSSMDAIKAGLAQFGEGNFSVEPVDEAVEDLGFFSHVSTTLHA